MSDSLDKAIYEIKKQEGPVARAFQEILEDTKRICEPQEQRSETMKTYNLPEAMIKAKENPGTIYETGEDGIAIQFLDSADCWAKTEYDNSVMLYDHKFHEAQPKPKPGEYWHFEKDDVYIKVKEHIYEKPILINQNVQKDIDPDFLEHVIAEQEETDLYSCDMIKGGIAQEVVGWIPLVNFQHRATRVTDERALMFFNAGRLPNEFKVEDLVGLSDISEVGRVTKVANQMVEVSEVSLWHKNHLTPVCFVEDRKDIGGAL